MKLFIVIVGISFSLNINAAPKESMTRAILNMPFEFSELDSMGKEELNDIVCGYKLGSDSASEAYDKSVEESKNSISTLEILNRRRSAYLNSYFINVSKASSLYERKFNQPYDCKQYTK